MEAQCRPLPVACSVVDRHSSCPLRGTRIIRPSWPRRGVDPGPAGCGMVRVRSRRAILNNKLRDNQRRQGTREAAIQRQDLRMRNLLELRAVVTGLKSLASVGRSRAAIATLGILLGGFLAAFGLEFRDRFRTALDGMSSDPIAAEMADAVK